MQYKISVTQEPKCKELLPVYWPDTVTFPIVGSLCIILRLDLMTSFVFSPEKDCSTLMAFGLDSSTVPPSFSNSTPQAQDRAAGSMDNKKGPFKVLVTGVSNIQNTFTPDL